MSEYETFVARHGEAAAQALVENLERYEGVRHPVHVPLSIRWQLLMTAPVEPVRMAA